MNAQTLSLAGVLALFFAAALPASVAHAGDGPDLARGEALYNYWCLPCHDDGPRYPGTVSLQIKYDGSLPALLTERQDLTPQVIRTFVRQGVLSMPPFRQTELTDEELDDLAAWLAAQS